jgi:membrane protease YdiL (CAAX protease family)
VFSRWKVPLVLLLCVASACLLTYPLWCLGQWAIQEWGWAGLSKYGVQKYFNRSFLLCAVVGALIAKPKVKTLGNAPVSSNFDRSSLLRGLGLGTLSFALLLVVGFCIPCIRLSDGKALMTVVGKAAMAAAVVGYLEEWLFRKHLLNAACGRFGLLLGPWLVAVLFASVHFLKPTPPPAGLEMDVWVGFRLLPLIFHRYTDPASVLGGWLTLVALGVLLSRLAMGSGVIWPAVGVHTAVIFWNKVLSSQLTVGHCEPWFAGNFQTGAVPLLTLSVMALCVVGRKRTSAATQESAGSA